MLKYERLRKIEEYVNQNRFVAIDELSNQFNVSQATIRRDLQILNRNNQVTLTYGGAVSKLKYLVHEPSYNIKSAENVDEKKRIAAEACKIIKPGNRIIIDSGTTNRQIIKYIKNLNDINIVTNDVIIAAELSNLSSVEVTVVGGSLRHGFFSLIGCYAETMIKDFHTDIAFIGMDSIDLNDGCMLTNINEVGFKRNIIKAANYVVVLCDHTKYESKSFIKVCPIDAINLFITGKELHTRIYKAFIKSGRKMILV